MYVAFLRGVNVSGKNKIDMKTLVVYFEQLGFSQVKSYLNSGNVIFQSPTGNIQTLETLIETMIFSKYDLDIKVIVRAQGDLDRILDAYQYDSIDGKNRYISLCKTAYDTSLDQAVNLIKKEDDLIEYLDLEINMYIPSGAGKSKLTNNYIEKKGSVIATTRNVNTLEKLKKLLSK